MEPLRNAEVDRLLFELTQPAGRRPLHVLRGLAANGSDRARRGRRDRADPLRRLSCGTARSTLRPGRPRRAVHVDRLAERERVPGPLDAEHEHAQPQPAAAHAAAAGRQQGLDRTQGRAVARPGGRDWWTPRSIKSMAAATSSTPSPSRCRSPSSGVARRPRGRPRRVPATRPRLDDRARPRFSDVLELLHCCRGSREAAEACEAAGSYSSTPA